MNWVPIALSLCVALASAQDQGQGATTSADPGARDAAKVKRLSLSSYSNSKDSGYFSSDFPSHPGGTQPLSGDAQAFFTWPDGSEGLFLARLQYWTPQGPGTPKPSAFGFYKRKFGT